jgi:Tfp pilus assembly protein PilX
MPLYSTFPDTHSGNSQKCRSSERGVILVISLIILVIVGLLTMATMRNTASTEKVSGAIRTTEMATEAAEIALRYCEESVVAVVRLSSGRTTTFVTAFSGSQILPADQMSRMESTLVWDSNAPEVFVLPLSLVNQSNLRETYKRAPECMVASLPVLLSGTTPDAATAFVITARGFGPEVSPVNSARSRPDGTEIWLQSHITLD